MVYVCYRMAHSMRMQQKLHLKPSSSAVASNVFTRSRAQPDHSIGQASCSPMCEAASVRPGPRARAGLRVVCMAHPRRVEKVSSQIRREISDMFVRDKVVQAAICPERNFGLDDQLSAVASVTETHVSNDLQVVKVYVSIYSDDRGKERAITNLKRLEPYVRKEIGQRVRLRLTPEIRFVYDDSLEEMDLVQKVLGPDEVQRFRQEIEMELGQARRGASAAAPAADADDDEGSGGFFDELEEDGSAAAGLFADEEEEEGEYVEQSSADVFAIRGPFDDLFRGDPEGSLVQQRQGKAAGRRSRPDKRTRQRMKQQAEQES